MQIPGIYFSSRSSLQIPRERHSCHTGLAPVPW
jgi:hypothetical protein